MGNILLQIFGSAANDRGFAAPAVQRAKFRYQCSPPFWEVNTPKYFQVLQNTAANTNEKFSWSGRKSARAQLWMLSWWWDDSPRQSTPFGIIKVMTILMVLLMMMTPYIFAPLVLWYDYQHWWWWRLDDDYIFCLGSGCEGWDWFPLGRWRRWQSAQMFSISSPHILQYTKHLTLHCEILECSNVFHFIYTQTLNIGFRLAWVFKCLAFHIHTNIEHWISPCLSDQMFSISPTNKH